MDAPIKDKKYEDIILGVDEANKECIDCKSPNVTCISINNGVILCPKCAELHLDLGPSISYIRSINDEWDEYLFNFVIFGGNTKFSNWLRSFSIEDSMEVELKYQTNACDYYRKALRAKVMGDPLEEAIDPSIAKEMCITKVASSEFDNYVIKTSKKPNPLMKVGGFFGNFGKKAWGEMKKAGQFVAEKTAPATDKLKQAGQFVAKKTAPATEKIKQGANYVGSQVKSAYSEVKEKIVKKKNEEGNAIEVNINDPDNINQNQNQQMDMNENLDENNKNDKDNDIDKDNDKDNDKDKDNDNSKDNDNDKDKDKDNDKDNDNDKDKDKDNDNNHQSSELNEETNKNVQEESGNDDNNTQKEYEQLPEKDESSK